MVTVPLGIGAYNRAYAGAPEIRLLNRFVEKSPSNLVEGRTLLARPGTTLLVEAGAGSIRRLYYQAGAFDDDLFIVSGSELYRYDEDGTLTQITGTILGTTEPVIAIVTGAGYEHLFITDGQQLQYYDGGTHATGTLTLSVVTPPNIVAQVIQLGDTYYQWSATVNAGTPDGTLGDPYLVLLGANDTESMANLVAAISFSGTLGTTYSNTMTEPNTDATITSSTATTIVVQARSPYALGNSVATTVTGADISWGAATLSGGGTHALVLVPTPDGLPMSRLTTVSSYVLCAQANSQRFYWIGPGEVTIDPLDFAEAESEPDKIVDLVTVGDHAWLVGQSSTEVWYATGDLTAPFAPSQGRTYARGALAGTTCKVKDTVMLVGDDGIVYSIGGAGAQPVSTNGIAERIRTQIRRERGL